MSTERIYKVILQVLEYEDNEATEPKLIHQEGVESGDIAWVVDEAKRKIIRYLESADAITSRKS